MLTILISLGCVAGVDGDQPVYVDRAIGAISSILLHYNLVVLGQLDEPIPRSLRELIDVCATINEDQGVLDGLRPGITVVDKPANLD